MRAAARAPRLRTPSSERAPWSYSGAWSGCRSRSVAVSADCAGGSVALGAGWTVSIAPYVPSSSAPRSSTTSSLLTQPGRNDVDAAATWPSARRNDRLSFGYAQVALRYAAGELAHTQMIDTFTAWPGLTTVSSMPTTCGPCSTYPAAGKTWRAPRMRVTSVIRTMHCCSSALLDVWRRRRTAGKGCRRADRSAGL